MAFLRTSQLDLSRPKRSQYIWRIGVLRFGVPWGVLMLLLEIWNWPKVPIAFTSRFVRDAAFGLVTLALAALLAGVLFGYATWYILRRLQHVKD